MNVAAPYPTVITPEILAKNASIPDAEIERDITETARDLEEQRRRADAFEVLAQSESTPHYERRMARFRADNAAYNIAQMKALLAFLRKLLAARAGTVPV